jgi:hypothetical protein
MTLKLRYRNTYTQGKKQIPPLVVELLGRNDSICHPERSLTEPRDLFVFLKIRQEIFRVYRDAVLSYFEVKMRPR